MKKQLLFLLTIIFSLNCFSQISYEKGYYITNTNQKINCLIKNIDWNNNPTEFKYKLSENSEPKKAVIKSVKEFGVDNISKYIRSIVNIDRSRENINYLSNGKKPIFKEEELFLKVLVEGNSNLYEYVEGNLVRYFYNIENSIIEQLIFKKYNIIMYYAGKDSRLKQQYTNNIGENNRFRQQLWSDLKCSNFKISKFKSIEYKKNDLIRLFVEYNKCNNQEYINYEEKQKGEFFNLTIRPRINNSSLTMQNSFSNLRNFDFGNKTGFGFGLEAEFILPFNKNKWAIIIEPTYQSFKSKKINNVSNIFGGKLIAKVDYSSIEVPLSLRHYFFLSKNSKVFLNASFIFDFSSNSSFEITRDDGTNFSALEIATRKNFAIGIGYKQNDRYSLEIRYQTSRKILMAHSLWGSDYKTLSIIFGYSLF
ncbi:MAG: tRNA modification GTPase [Cellulophaga sp.]